MPWPCRLVECNPEGNEIGDMWYVDDESFWTRHLSKHYLGDWAGKRKPLMVMTPAGQWCIDGQSVNHGKFNEDGGWRVTGEPPNITVSPSINFPGLYHGWMKDGVLSDPI